MKDSFLFLAEGFEEIEAISVIDILRRADIPVKTVSITGSYQVSGAHGIPVIADLLFESISVEDAPWLILPGGLPGADNLYNFAPLQNLLRQQAESADGRIAAICAAPAVVLGQSGLLDGEQATCYPGFEDKLQGCEHVDSPVVVSGKFVTANGPANAIRWALNIVKCTKGEIEAGSIANGLLYYPRLEAGMDHYFG
ncbi:MAG: DJ-1/PfpI family protein [Muribaculaceae bacterium]|nr:DJ-1/PfpI family protein [Muribaculaceae bacterium]